MFATSRRPRGVIGVSAIVAVIAVGSSCGGSDDAAPVTNPVQVEAADSDGTADSTAPAQTDEVIESPVTEAPVDDSASGDIAAIICDAVRATADEIEQNQYGEREVMTQAILAAGFAVEGIGAAEYDQIFAELDETAQRDCPTERDAVLSAYGLNSLVAILQDQG
jgi:hypothetical protein